MELLAWWNLIFEVPFALLVLYALAMALGVVPDSEMADPEAELGVDPGMLFKALSLLGVGRVPFSLVISSFVLLWSVLGWSSNFLLSATALPPHLYVWISVAVASAGAATGTRVLAGGLARILPTHESYGVPEAGLVGSTAEVLHRVDESFGMARLRDPWGNIVDVRCVLAAGAPPQARGAQVILADYDPATRIFTVRPDELHQFPLANPS
jgi:hypothetical protein